MIYTKVIDTGLYLLNLFENVKGVWNFLKHGVVRVRFEP